MLGRLLNPFSDEALNVVKKSPPLNEVPPEIFDLAKKKIAWKKMGRRPPESLVEGYEEESDVQSYHVLYQAAALNFSVYSGEVRLVKDVTEELTRARLNFLMNETGEDYVVGLIDELLGVEEIIPMRDGGGRLGPIQLSKRELYALGRPKYGVKNWKSLVPLLRAKEARLTDWYIIEGFVPLGLQELIKFYSKLVAIKALDYIIGVHEKSFKSRVEVHERFKEVADALSRAAGGYYKAAIVSGVAKRLDPEKFPPCITHILEGVSTGSRNYAISVLLTSFLSYARIAPRKVREPKIVDFVKDPKVLTEEIIPLIYEAAERCEPPLFDDQPMERLNISYHLGLGLTKDIRLEDSGSSRWYFPPNCEKIRREAPGLCRPDDTCKTIKNPLNYYFAKLRGEKIEEKPEEREIEEATAPRKIEPLGKEMKGRITEIYKGSGLIQRCPKCNRWIMDNFCIVHSDVEGVWDLRIKAKFEEENSGHNLIFMRKATEKAANITLDEAKKLGEVATLKKINESLIGKYFEIEGERLDKNFIVKSIKEV
ncbi:MAG: hypothetical protein ACE5PM_09115, partial [Candidatus Hydrothermarchaeales archaeon]